jgi:hypothetical protein
MNNKLERIWKEAVMALMKHYPGIALETCRKTMKSGQFVSSLRFELNTSEHRPKALPPHETARL